MAADDVDVGLRAARPLDGEHGMLPREFGRLERRTLVSREAIAAITLVAIGSCVVAVVVGDDARFLASVYSFGVLLAFTLAQLAVIRLRRREPDLGRPFRARPDVRIRGVDVPLPALVGAPLTARRLGARDGHAPGRALRGPGVARPRARRLRRRRAGASDAACSRTSTVAARCRPGAAFRRVLVPMKLGDIGEEMVATAVALAKERGARIEAITVVRVPRERALDAGCRPTSPSAPRPRSRRRGRSARRTASRCSRHRPRPVDRPRDRRGGDAARRRPDRARLLAALAAAVALLLADRRPRAQNARCEVLVVAFPEGVFEEA